MSLITSLYVHKVVAGASPGVETRDLVEGLGLDPNGPIDPARLVSSQDYYEFFAALAERDPEGLALPLRIGAAMRVDEYGAFGLAWKSAPTLRGSFARSERYGDVLGSADGAGCPGSRQRASGLLRQRWAVRAFDQARRAGDQSFRHLVRGIQQSGQGLDRFLVSGCGSKSLVTATFRSVVSLCPIIPTALSSRSARCRPPGSQGREPSLSFIRREDAIASGPDKAFATTVEKSVTSELPIVVNGRLAAPFARTLRE